MIRIGKGRAIVNGNAAPFRASPNVGGALVPEYIVLHDTASGLNDSGSIAWLTDRASKVSAHVVIGRDGKITQLVPFNVKAWHAGQSVWRGRQMLNGFSIGIEIVNPGRLQKVAEGVYKGICTIDTTKDKSLVVQHAKTAAHGDGYWLAYSRAQVAAVTELCQALCQEYPIKEIVTHWLISPGRKVDTNPLFPLDQVRMACTAAVKPVALSEVAAPEAADSDEADGGEPDIVTVSDDTVTTKDEIAKARGDTDESAGGLGQVWKLVKSRIAWASSALGTVSLGSLSFLQDWRIMAILALLVFALVALVIWERSRKP